MEKNGKNMKSRLLTGHNGTQNNIFWGKKKSKKKKKKEKRKKKVRKE